MNPIINGFLSRSHFVLAGRFLDFKLEALLTFCDFLEDNRGGDDIVAEYAVIGTQCGAREAIEGLYGLGDQELEHLADELLVNMEEAVS